MMVGLERSVEVVLVVLVVLMVVVFVVVLVWGGRCRNYFFSAPDIEAQNETEARKEAK